MSYLYLRKLIGQMLAIAFFILTALFGISFLLNNLLFSEAESTGLSWTRHIQARLPNLTTPIDLTEDPHTSHLPKPSQLADLSRDIIKSGTVYQIDFINSVCLDTISFGGFLPTQKTSHQINNLPIVSPAQLAHIFHNEKAHIISDVKPLMDGQRPIDRQLVRTIVKKNARSIFIHNGNNEAQPGKFAEVYHPIFANGKPAYIVRVLVNLDAKAASYQKLLQSTAIILLLLGALFFAYPARKYIIALKKQRSSDARARYLAGTDLLTNKANRNAFQDMAPKFLENCLREGHEATLYIIDVNSFKAINDYHGHAAGDLALKTVAELLQNQLNGKGLLARIGGDEFAVLLDEVDKSTIINIDKPLIINSAKSLQGVTFTLSAGSAKFPHDGRVLAELMQNADLALYATKTAKSARITEYDQAMSACFKAKIDLFRDFKNALSECQIVPHYQVVMDMETDRVIGMEALARWNHPEKGLLTPAYFCDVLDDCEISGLLGKLMIDQTMRDMGTWYKQNIPFISVGVNIGEGDLMRPGFLLDIAAGLARYNLPQGSLAIEVTENCLFGKNKDDFTKKLHELRALGCFMALDDFGTGYSSLAQLQNLPLTTLKIDKSFVNELEHNTKDQAIVETMILLGKKIGFKTIAEGVETQEQHECLKRMGCSMGQGYLYSKPIPAAQIPALIARLNNRQASPKTKAS